MVSTKRHRLISLRPRNLSVPSYRPTQRSGWTDPVRQLVSGSGEGQHTGTSDDDHRIARKEAHAMRSLSLLLPFSTIAYPLVCWGGGLMHYQTLAPDAGEWGLVAGDHL